MLYHLTYMLSNSKSQLILGLILLDTAGYSRDVMVNSGMLENLVNKLFMKCSD